MKSEYLLIFDKPCYNEIQKYLIYTVRFDTWTNIL